MAVTLRKKTGRKRKTGEFKGKQVTTWYLDYYIDGKRWYESLPIKYIPNHATYGDLKGQREKAEAIRAQRENEILNKGYEYTPKEIGKINFCDYFQNFIDKYNKPSKRMFVASLNWFKEYLKHEEMKPELISIKNLDYELCRGFAAYLKSSKLTGETPYDYFEKFKHIVSELHKKGYINKNPIDQFTKADKIKVEANEDLEKEILYFEELNTLDKTYCGNEDVKNAFLFSCFTGLGVAEIRKLTWDNVKNNTLNTKRAKTGTKLKFKLSQSAIAILNRQDKAEKYIFNLPSSTSINKNIKNWVSRAEIDKHITYYCSRHSFAVMLLEESGANLKAVADCLGHTTTNHTVRYLKYINRSIDQAMSNLPKLG